MITLEDVEAASERIADLVDHTPVHRSRALSAMTGVDVHLKLETFQRTGAFKIRGASNRIRTLSATDRDVGVVTASAGNHAQGVALAATESGVDATVVMPTDAAISKVEATRNYGADIRLAGANYEEAQEIATDIATSEGRTYVHAFDDPAVIAGQGTIGLEIIEDVPSVDAILVPIGGGGLIAGIATAVKALASNVTVIGVQAAGAASVPQSLERGEIVERETVDTIADGIATRRVGDVPFPIIQRHVDDVVTVTDDEIAIALTRLIEQAKVVVEPAAAVGVAALLAGRVTLDRNATVVPVLSGGNIDLNVLGTVILRGLVETGRYAKIRTVLKDRPGALETLAHTIAAEQANINAIRHDRSSRDVALNAAEVELELELRGEAHLQAVIAALDRSGYVVEHIP